MEDVMNEYHQLWKPIAAAFDPQKAIEIGDRQGYYVERPDSPLWTMVNHLRLTPDVPRKILLTGQRGSGKTSELARLATELLDEFAVVWLDVEEELETFEFGAIEVMVGMARQLDQALKLRKEFNQFRDTLFSYAEERGKETVGKLTSKPVEYLGIDIGRVFFQREVKQRLERPPVLREIVSSLNLLIKQAQDKARKPLLMIVDGLDKVDLDLARRLFVHNDLLAQPRCHIVYAIPFSLYFSVGRQEASDQGYLPRYLPNLHPNKASHRALLRRVVLVRLPESETGLITRPALDELVRMSGGMMRDLIMLVNHSILECLSARTKQIDKAIARRAIATARLDKARELAYEYYWEELAYAQRTHQLTDRTANEYDAEGQVRTFLICDRLLQGRHIVNYANDNPWYDVHPVVKLAMETREEDSSGA
jgi:DNA polymerase III delta prime subunit